MAAQTVDGLEEKQSQAKANESDAPTFQGLASTARTKMIDHAAPLFHNHHSARRKAHKPIGHTAKQMAKNRGMAGVTYDQ